MKRQRKKGTKEMLKELCTDALVFFFVFFSSRYKTHNKITFLLLKYHVSATTVFFLKYYTCFHLSHPLFPSSFFQSCISGLLISNSYLEANSCLLAHFPGIAAWHFSVQIFLMVTTENYVFMLLTPNSDPTI